MWSHRSGDREAPPDSHQSTQAGSELTSDHVAGETLDWKACYSRSSGWTTVRVDCGSTLGVIVAGDDEHLILIQQSNTGVIHPQSTWMFRNALCHPVRCWEIVVGFRVVGACVPPIRNDRNYGLTVLHFSSLLFFLSFFPLNFLHCLLSRYSTE
jgi:hypothetical protein